MIPGKMEYLGGEQCLASERSIEYVNKSKIVWNTIDYTIDRKKQIATFEQEIYENVCLNRGTIKSYWRYTS